MGRRIPATAPVPRGQTRPCWPERGKDLPGQTLRTWERGGGLKRRTPAVPSFTSVLMESSGQSRTNRCAGPGLRAGLLLGLGVRKAWPRLWQRLMLHSPSAVPSSSPALSLLLTPSGSRATRQRDPVPAPGSWTLRHTLATKLATRPGLLKPPKGLASAKAHSWASPGHGCFCRELLGAKFKV